MEERLTAVPCVLCTEPVRLIDCKLNDLGEPVHESCLADHLKEDIKRHKAAFSNWEVEPNKTRQ